MPVPLVREATEAQIDGIAVGVGLVPVQLDGVDPVDGPLAVVGGDTD